MGCLIKIPCSIFSMEIIGLLGKKVIFNERIYSGYVFKLTCCLKLLIKKSCSMVFYGLHNKLSLFHGVPWCSMGFLINKPCSIFSMEIFGLMGKLSFSTFYIHVRISFI